MGGGGGGGGPTTITKTPGTNTNSIIFQVGGGGGGSGGGGIREYTYQAGGAGGGGGGYGGGGGAGGSSNVTAGSAGTGGGSSSSVIGINKGYAGRHGLSAVGNVNGAGGGGGYGGDNGDDASGAADGSTHDCPPSASAGRGGSVPNSIFDSDNYCSGGDGSNSGKPGALRLYYTYPPIKCEYHLATNGGGGGGAGQVWIGEINVTPGQELNFNIGIGGKKTTTFGTNGETGGDTSITSNGTTLISVTGGEGGQYKSASAYISSSFGHGGSLKTTSDSTYAKYVNWKEVDLHTGGENGGAAKTAANGGGGGKGGNLYNLDGILVEGGSESGTQSDGQDAPSNNYGAGGAGGGGAGVALNANPGHGGKGANGYIYVEWGNGNGGGGASGQIVTKKDIWVTPGTKIKITIGKGGKGTDILPALNGVSGMFGQKGEDGGDTFITTNEGVKALAKGGEGGYPGRTNHGKGGNYNDEEDAGGTKSPNYIENSIKGNDGTDEYGGEGGSITSEICPLFDALIGLGGCGGNMPNGNCANSSSTPFGKNAGKVGGGGGGGAIKDNTAYKGGTGGKGMAVIEWNN